MASNRIKACWFLLLVLLYTASVVLSVGETQARYQTTVEQATVVESQPKGITSDCLVTRSEAPVTVLVGELSYYTPKSVKFWMKSSGADAVGKLAWSVSDPEMAQYLKITMGSGPDSIDSNMEIDLLRDAKMEITMTVLPTELARNTAHDTMKINVLVTWGEEMWGTFQVILPEVKEETESSDSDSANNDENNEDPEQIPDANIQTDATEQTENSGSVSTGTDAESIASDSVENNLTDTAQQVTMEAAMAVSETGETQESTESTENTEETPTDPTETTGETVPDDPTETTGETEPAEPTEESTESTGEGTEPTGTSTEPTEPETDSTEETTEELDVDPTEETQPPEEDPIRMETLRSFDPAQKLPVKIHLTENVTSIRLGQWVVDAEATENPEEPVLDFDSLPDYTRFSLNHGESYYMMYDGCIAEFTMQGITELSVLLDFSHAELKDGESMVLGMQAYSGEVLLESSRFTITPDAPKSCRTAVHSLTQTISDTESVTESTGTGWQSQILSRNNVLEYTFPIDWANADLEYSVQILAMAEDGSLVYNHVPLTAEGLSATYTNYNGVHNLVFQVRETLPQAGTYRLKMKWSYEGICFAEQQTTFFINYSAYSAYTLGGQEVP